MPSVFRLLLLLGLAAGLRGGETVLTVTTPEHTLAFTAAEFAALPRTESTVTDPHSGQPVKYAGVTVQELLARAGAPLDAKLRGAALQLAVVFHAKDGYNVVYALADFDPAFSSRTIILADQRDGQPLGATAAPFQVIAPGDKKGARWARMVTSIEVLSVGPVRPAPAAKP